METIVKTRITYGKGRGELVTGQALDAVSNAMKTIKEAHEGSNIIAHVKLVRVLWSGNNFNLKARIEVVMKANPKWKKGEYTVSYQETFSLGESCTSSSSIAETVVEIVQHAWKYGFANN